MGKGLRCFLLTDSLLSSSYTVGMFIFFCTDLRHYTDFYLLGAAIALVLALPWIFLMMLSGGLLLAGKAKIPGLAAGRDGGPAPCSWSLFWDIGLLWH